MHPSIMVFLQQICLFYKRKNMGRLDYTCWNAIVEEVSLQQITVNMTNNGSFNIVFSIIYEENTAADTKTLWAELQQMHIKFSNLHWILVGYFNVCRYT